MRYITAIVLASAAGLVAANPLTRRADWTKFPKNTVFDIILEKSKVTLDQLKDFKYGTVIDIDLYDNISNGQTTIQDLKKAGKIVVCYFSAGSREDWRDDAKLWNPSDYGKVLKKSDKEDWKGENWANVKSDNVRKIMKARIELAAKSGCQAVDPDNVDGFDNDTGFSYKESDYADYVNYLADLAHTNNMAVGLKNALNLIPSVINKVDFAVNEQCHKENECGDYIDFTRNDKAVFNIEYGLKDCSDPTNVVLSTVVKGNNPDDQELDRLGGQC